MVAAVDAEAARLHANEHKRAESIVNDNERKRLTRAAAAPSSAVPVSIVERWMSRRVNTIVEPHDATRLVDWCFFSHPSAERSVRAFNSCAQRRVFLACELKRATTGQDRNGVPFLVRHCVAQLLHDLALTMHPVMFGIASDFRSFHVLRLSIDQNMVIVQYSGAIELAPRAVVDRLQHDNSVSWCDAFASVGAGGSLSVCHNHRTYFAVCGHELDAGTCHRLRVDFTSTGCAVQCWRRFDIDAVQAKMRGTDAEWDNHDIVIHDYLGSSSRSAVFSVTVERRDSPAGSGVRLVLKLAHSHRSAAVNFRNEVRMLLAERGRADIGRIVGWYNDGFVQFLILSTFGVSLSRTCLCTPDRRVALLRALAETVGGVLRRWHSQSLVFSDLHAGNLLVREDMSVFLCDLETLAEIFVENGVVKCRAAGSPVSHKLRTQSHDVDQLVNLISLCWR